MGTVDIVGRARRVACITAGVAAFIGCTGPLAWADEPDKPPAKTLTAPLPLSAFANLPMVDELTLAPSGQRFAALLNAGESTVLVVRDLMGGDAMKPLLKTDNKQFRFNWIHWANDERIVFSLAYPSRLGWVEFSETRLISMKRDGTGAVNLVRQAAGMLSNRPAQLQDRVIDWLHDYDQHLLLELDDDNVGAPSVFRVDVETGKRQRVHGGRNDVSGWMTDTTHRVRVGTRQTDTKLDVLVCDPDGKNWRTAWTYDIFDRSAVRPLGFGTDPNQLFITADHEGRRAVFEVNLADPALPRKLLLSDPVHDIEGTVLTDPKTGAVVGVRSGVLHEGEGVWDADVKRLLAAVDQALPNRYNKLQEMSADGSRYLLYSIGNGQPGQYFVGLRQQGTLSVVAETYPELVDKPLARKKPGVISARDGTPLRVLVTLPLGREPKSLPTVLLPHGGPISLDGMEFDPWVQFLSDRGYAVLQVNFRGSAGFGHDLRNAGLKRWGLEMQDDLSDALQWLVKSGVADPARVCIVGASYGGYAALMGAAKTPELYRCVFSFAGVSDLIDLGSHQRHFRHGAEVYEKQVGSTWSDRDQLKATSPRRLAAQIKAPVLLMHGTLDRSVPFEQSVDMAAALKRAGKPHRFIKQEEGDHHLSNQAQRTQFFQELEAFLAEHLGGTPPAQAAMPDLSTSSR